MIANFTPVSAAIGGVLIGLAATLLMLFNGRVAGISGILAACLNLRGSDKSWSAVFIAGLILAPLTARLAGFPMPAPRMPDSWSLVVVAGVLVGFGSRLGGGCTSGHGVCGMARFSTRSIVATAVFMATAIFVVALSRHVIGAQPMQMVAATMCGLIFGWGLLISEMTQPTKVIGFLDVFGTWDPSLGVVMAAALAVSGIGFRYAASRACPLLAPKSLWPSRTEIDPPLVIGAMLFGIGWGLVGLCPGPALENLATLSPHVIAFVVAMAFGMVLHRIWHKRGAGPERLHAPTAAMIDG